ncbi:polysaccharide lyase family 7 protein [Shewanella sp. HL-SH8]|uniref:polysaccharide lyase family 7 protein n=1 Tax=Shewanella sp. HL-SH8 TaxID=3436242 RepID=UPI003EB81BB2
MTRAHFSLLAICVITGSTAAATQLDTAKQFNLDPSKAPAQNFDLSKWKITLPELAQEGKSNGKALEIDKNQLSSAADPYVHPQWFYTDQHTGAMIFVAPNKAPTTPNSKNTRSELRAMLAEQYDQLSNNFVVASHPNASKYGAIGGRLTAQLSVDHVSTSGDPAMNGAFGVVIGQIHAPDNEPLKIQYRKLPEHEFGSLSWNYELNPLPKLQDATDSKGIKYRQDIRHDVFGKNDIRAGGPEPKEGIKLGEIFAYDVNVKGNTMHLTFTKNPGTANEIIKTFAVDLAKGHYEGHEVDQGYKNDWMYYKAGAYNQCNTQKSSSNCQSRGMEAGDYTQVSFYQLMLNQ